MGNKANCVFSEGNSFDFFVKQITKEVGRLNMILQRKNNNIGVNRKKLFHVGLLFKNLCQTPGPLVIVFQAGYIIVEGIDAGSGEEAGLPHASAHHLADAACVMNILLSRKKQRADGSAKPFRKAERNAVKIFSDFRG